LGKTQKNSSRKATDAAKRTRADSRKVESAAGSPAVTKRLTLDIPTELHRAIKINAVQEGVTMVEMLRKLLMEHYALAGPATRKRTQL